VISWKHYPLALHDVRNFIDRNLLWNLFGNQYLWIASLSRILKCTYCFYAIRISIMWELVWKLTAGQPWERNTNFLVANAPAHALNRACEQRPPNFFRALQAYIDILKTVISLMLKIMAMHDLENSIHCKRWWNLFGNRSLWIARYRLFILIVHFDARRFSIMWELDWKLTVRKQFNIHGRECTRTRPQPSMQGTECSA
jgi:hypothetical protein